jgi:hypothetical protein
MAVRAWWTGKSAVFALGLVAIAAVVLVAVWGRKRRPGMRFEAFSSSNFPMSGGYSAPGHEMLLQPQGYSWPSQCEFRDECMDLTGRTVTLSDGTPGECFMNGVACPLPMPLA